MFSAERHRQLPMRAWIGRRPQTETRRSGAELAGSRLLIATGRTLSERRAMAWKLCARPCRAFFVFIFWALRLSSPSSLVSFVECIFTWKCYYKFSFFCISRRPNSSVFVCWIGAQLVPRNRRWRWPRRRAGARAARSPAFCSSSSTWRCSRPSNRTVSQSRFCPSVTRDYPRPRGVNAHTFTIHRSLPLLYNVPHYFVLLPATLPPVHLRNQP